MSTAFSFDSGVTLIGGGAVTAADLEESLALAPRLVAADGGADAAISRGHLPELVIGDFDSISTYAQTRLGPERLLHVSEQDSTDFAKALSRIEAPFVIAIGFAGRRLDHTLAALNVMARHPRQPCIMLAAEDIVFAAPSRLQLDLEEGTRMSLFPMGAVTGRADGLRWPIDDIEFAPAGRVGTSNEALGPVTLEVAGPMMVMLPRECLRIALRALSDPMSG